MSVLLQELTNLKDKKNCVKKAQNMINSGAEVSDVQQNVKISQALLDAINNAKENASRYF